MITSTSVLRKQNKNRIFNYIYNSKCEVTKQDIANSLSLSLPTVTQNLQELEEQRLIKYTGTSESTGGRKPRIIEINASSKFSIGVSVTKNNLRISCANLIMQEHSYKKVDISSMNIANINNIILHELELFINELELKSQDILGVCIAFPGIISQDKAIIENAPTLKLKNFMLGPLYKALPYPCNIDNDANLGALTEWHTKNNFIYLSVDKGVGGAVVFGQKPYLGDTGKSGEFGHMCIDATGPLCSCGKTGCLEAFCSTDRLSADFNCSLDEFFEKVKLNIEPYTKAFSTYLNMLAKGINNIHMVTDCDIIIGGALAQFLSNYLQDLKYNVLQTDALNESANYIKLSKHGPKTTSLGAAFYHVQNYIVNLY